MSKIGTINNMIVSIRAKTVLKFLKTQDPISLMSANSHAIMVVDKTIDDIQRLMFNVGLDRESKVYHSIKFNMAKYCITKGQFDTARQLMWDIIIKANNAEVMICNRIMKPTSTRDDIGTLSTLPNDVLSKIGGYIHNEFVSYYAPKPKTA